VEQLLHTPFQKENAITVIKPMPEKAVQVSVGVRGSKVDQFVQTLQATLGKNSVHSVQSLDEISCVSGPTRTGRPFCWF